MGDISMFQYLLYDILMISSMYFCGFMCGIFVCLYCEGRGTYELDHLLQKFSEALQPHYASILITSDKLTFAVFFIVNLFIIDYYMVDLLLY